MDSQDLEGRTPLSWAVENGHQATVKLLLSRNVQANSHGIHVRGPLWWATKMGRIEIVKLLLPQNDIDMNTRDNDGQTTLLCAAKAGFTTIIALLLTRKDVQLITKIDMVKQLFQWQPGEGMKQWLSFC